MAFKITVNGTDISPWVNQCSFSLDGLDRPRCTFQAESEVSVAQDDTVLVYAPDGTTPLFGGLVDAVKKIGWTEKSVATLLRVDALGWEVYLDWCSISLAYTTDVALEDVLADMVTQVLHEYGLTYTPTTTGVMLAPFTWDEISGTDAWRQLRSRLSAALRITPTKAITVTAPGASSTPFAITDSTLWRLARFERGDQPSERANRVRLKFGPTGVFRTTQRWVADGTTTAWVTDLPAADPSPGVVLLDDGVTPRLATVGAGAEFEWDRTSHAPFGTLSVGTVATPGAGVKIVLGPSITAGDPATTDGYMAVYPFTIALGSGSPPREYRAHYPDVNEFGPAMEIATQTLAKLNRVSAQVLDVALDGEDGFDAMQALTVNTAARGGVVGTFLVGKVDVTVQRGLYTYRFQATEGLETQASVVERTRRALGGGGSSSSVAVVPGGASGGGTVTGAMSPVYLGGQERLSFAAADWTRIPQAPPYVAPASFTARVRCVACARASGVGVTVRLRRLTDDATVEATEVVSTTPTERTFTVPIVAGERYAPEAKCTTGSGEVYVLPTVLEMV